MSKDSISMLHFFQYIKKIQGNTNAMPSDPLQILVFLSRLSISNSAAESHQGVTQLHPHSLTPVAD